MTSQVVVTGFGVRTAFGHGVEALRQGLFSGTPAFTEITRFDPAPYRSRWAAQSVDTPTLGEALERCGQDAIQMARGLPAGAGVFTGLPGDFTAITRFWRSGTRGDEPREAVAASSPAVQTSRLAQSLGASGPQLSFTNACVASANAMVHACRLIAAGRLEAAVCGGGYLVEEEVFAKFDSGRAFSRDGMVRAFSADRSGLLLGDGVACVVLESAESAQARGATALARIIGWGMGSDAFHPVRPHPQGAGLGRSLRAALTIAGIDPGSLDYVNAHGTGTPFNDSAETIGLHGVLGDAAGGVPVSSTKTMTGHMLEATAIVEFIICLLALQEQLLPPTVGYARPDPQCDLDYVTEGARPAAAHRAASVSAAFGGLNAALVLER